MSVLLAALGRAGAFATIALAVGVSPGLAQTKSPSWLDPTLLDAARKEGSVVVYTSTNEREGLPLFKIFEDATGIKFNYIRGNDASLLSRIAIETRAKQPSFDIVHMTNAHKMPPALLAQFDPSEAKRASRSSRGARSGPARSRSTTPTSSGCAA